MRIPDLPDDFYPEEDENERIDRWFVLEEEARQMQQRDIMLGEEPELPRLPRHMVGCTNESALRMWGF